VSNLEGFNAPLIEIGDDFSCGNSKGIRPSSQDTLVGHALLTGVAAEGLEALPLRCHIMGSRRQPLSAIR
jgi:hypothetical protein